MELTVNRRGLGQGEKRKGTDRELKGVGAWREGEKKLTEN